MPKTSVAEWYNIYPPFEHGFQKDGEMWEYMNRGVSTIVAGELAHGAFQNGYETYGIDILNRVLNLARKHDNYLHGTYKWKLPETKIGNFTTISLAKAANTDFRVKTVKEFLVGMVMAKEMMLLKFRFGMVALRYDDGSTFTVYILGDKIDNWWFP